MKLISLLTLIILFTIPIYSCSFVKLSLEEKIDSSLFIIEGEVISKESFWNSKHTKIYTSNKISITKVLKGKLYQNEVFIQTEGGKIGSFLQVSSSLLSLEVGDKGYYFCNLSSKEERPNSKISLLEVYGSQQGFIKYNRTGTHIADPFSHYIPINFEKLVSRKLSQKIKLKNSLSFQIKSNKSLTLLSFYPSTITAGTRSILTITGTDFGSSGPSSNTYLEFPDANYGGQLFYQPVQNEYLIWTDTLIQVYVPSRAGSGYFNLVVNGNSISSFTALNIPYSQLNSGTSTTKYMPYHIDNNGNGGMDWRYNANFTNSFNNEAFVRAMLTLKCATGVNWDIDSINTTPVNTNATDGINLVSMSSTLPAGVLGVCHLMFQSCNGGSEWFVSELDVLFDSGTNWFSGIGTPNNSQYDFETVALHELGHGHLLGHVIDGNDLMNYSLSVANHNRSLNYHNISAGNFIMSQSITYNNCNQAPMNLSFSGLCAPTTNNDGAIYVSSRLNNYTCIGYRGVYFDLYNFGSDTIYTAQIGWSINNVQKPDFTWNGSIPPGGNLEDILLNNEFFGNFNYDVSIWVESVNSVLEQNVLNDSVSYSFSPAYCLNNNAGITQVDSLPLNVCPNDFAIYGTLKNFGDNSLNNVKIITSINGVDIDTVEWNGYILPGDSLINVYCGNYLFSDSTYSVEVRTELPNGIVDPHSFNDSSSLLYEPSCPNVDVGILKIEGIDSIVCKGNYPISFCISNNGLDTISSFTIQCEVNGVLQSSINWSGSLVFQDSLCRIGLGNISLNENRNIIKVLLISPNGVVDENLTNNIIIDTVSPIKLSGVYTLGGVNPDFTTFTELQNKLNMDGVCGSVVINVRSGRYEEHIKLNYIEGSSVLNTITIQSEAEDKDSVTLIHGHISYTNNENYTVALDGTKYLIIKNISIKTLHNAGWNNSYARVLLFSNGASNILFENNLIASHWTYGTTQNSYSDCISGRLSSSSFINNIILNGNKGINLESFSGNSDSLLIEGNVFNGQLSSCLKTHYLSYVKIINNEFYSSLPLGSSLNAIVCSYTGSSEVSNNFIDIKGHKGLSINGYGNINSKTLIKNNSISINAENVNARGILINSIDSILIVHNSINLYLSNPLSIAVGLNNCSQGEILNNQIISTLGKAVSLSSSNVLSNYNNIYCSGSVLALIDGISYSNLNTIQNNLGVELNSISMIPNFHENTVLIPYNPLALNKGIASYVTDDILGESRSLTPDMGAYEVDSYDFDIGITSSVLDSIIPCNDSIELTLDIKNYGQQDIDSGFIYWKFNNGNVDSIFFLANIPAGTIYNNFSIGKVLFIGNTENKIKLWASFPNGHIDSLSLNDTLTYSGIYTGLSGAYSVGNVGSDFTAIHNAIDYMNAHGVCGPVELNILAGTYSGHWELGNIKGASAINTVTFQSQSLDSTEVVFDYTNNNPYSGYIFSLVDASFLRFKHLTFSPMYRDHFVFLCENGSDVQISNSVFEKGKIGTELYGNSISNFRIISNDFKDGSKVEMNNSSDFYCVKNNFITSTQGYVTFISVVNFSRVNVSNNSFNTANSTGTTIYFKNISGDLLIEKNYISVSGIVNIDNYFGDISSSANIINNMFISENRNLSIYNSNKVNIINNSFNCSTVLSKSNLFLSNNINLSVYNNLLRNLNYCIFRLNNQSTFFSDNNAWYSNHDFFIRDNGGNQTFHSWQSNFGRDLHSIRVDPNYFSSTDLHVNNPYIDNLGTGIFNLTEDFDGELRGITNPDIGADEFEVDWAQITDISIDTIFGPWKSCGENDSLFAVITNKNIQDTVFGFEVSWSVEGVVQDNFVLNDTILPNSTIDSLFIGVYHYQNNENYIVGVNVANPNGVTDNFEHNNLIEFDFQSFTPIIIEGPSFYCLNDSIELVASDISNLNSYSWSTGDTLSSIYVNQTGIYTLESISSNNCLSIDSVNITVMVGDEIELTSNPPQICPNGGSVELTISGNNPLSSVLWQNGSAEESITTYFTGAYTATVTDNLGCVSEISYDVVEFSPIYPSIEVIGNEMVCNNIYDSYQWYLYGTLLPNDTNNIIVGTISGEYEVVVMDSNDCGYMSTSIYFNYSDVNLNENTEVKFNVINNELTVYSTYPLSKNYYLYNSLGSIIKTGILTSSTKIDLNTYSKGVYFFRYGNLTKKIEVIY